MSKKGSATKGGKNDYVFHGIPEGLKQSLAHVRGEIGLPSRHYDVPPNVDVKVVIDKNPEMVEKALRGDYPAKGTLSHG
jgi:hypothetical protein